MSALELEALLRGEEGSTPEQQRLAEVVALLRAEPPGPVSCETTPLIVVSRQYEVCVAAASVTPEPGGSVAPT